MYLASRRTRVTSAAGLEWATTIQAHVKEATGNDLQLWGNIHSAGFGTISWTWWWADLTSLEQAFDKLQVDPKYNELAAAGADLIEGDIDDALYQTISGDPDPGDVGTVQYVASVRAVAAAGNLVRSVTAGLEIAEKATAIGGHNTLFLRSLTGPYGEIGWLTGYPDLAAVGAAQDKLAADPEWLTFLDTTGTAFVEDPSVTVATLFRKLA